MSSSQHLRAGGYWGSQLIILVALPWSLECIFWIFRLYFPVSRLYSLYLPVSCIPISIYSHFAAYPLNPTVLLYPAVFTISRLYLTISGCICFIPLYLTVSHRISPLRKQGYNQKYTPAPGGGLLLGNFIRRVPPGYVYIQYTF